MTRYSKALTAIVGAVSTWAATYYPDDPDVQKWLGLALALVTVLGVFSVPNTPPAGQPADPNISERGAADVGLAIVVGALVLAVALVLAFGVNVDNP